MRKHPKMHRWSYHFEIVNLGQYPFFVWFLLKLLRMDLADCTSCLSSWRCKPPWHHSHMNRPVCTDKQLSLGQKKNDKVQSYHRAKTLRFISSVIRRALLPMQSSFWEEKKEEKSIRGDYISCKHLSIKTSNSECKTETQSQSQF